MDVFVKNKLEIRPGNIIQVPGLEPISSLTGIGLSKYMANQSSIISVTDALKLIPGSRIVGKFNPAGQNGTGLFFELPNGPPPDGGKCCMLNDWYKILRDNARYPTEEEQTAQEECVGFSINPCQQNRDTLQAIPDPAMTNYQFPNSGLGGRL